MATTSLIDRLKKASVTKSEILSKSVYFCDGEVMQTPIPMLNVAFGGSFSGGLTAGITIFAGESKTLKTYLALYCMKAYFDKYPDASAIIFDSEFGSTQAYYESIGLDSSKILQVIIENLEQLRANCYSMVKEINRGEHVFILIDSIGNLASTKEVEKADQLGNSKDMTRNQEIRSLFRIVTPMVNSRNLPFLCINATYASMSLYGNSQVISGGQGPIYAANSVFLITKSQIKGADNKTVEGFNYNISVEKSRYVKEKSKISIQNKYELGFNKYFGLLELALEGGFVEKPSMGWYSRVDKTTGELESKKWRAKDTDTDEFWDPIMNNPDFEEFVKCKYKLGYAQSHMTLKEAEQQAMNDSEFPLSELTSDDGPVDEQVDE